MSKYNCVPRGCLIKIVEWPFSSSLWLSAKCKMRKRKTPVGSAMSSFSKLSSKSPVASALISCDDWLTVKPLYDAMARIFCCLGSPNYLPIDTYRVHGGLNAADEMAFCLARFVAGCGIVIQSFYEQYHFLSKRCFIIST